MTAPTDPRCSDCGQPRATAIDTGRCAACRRQTATTDPDAKCGAVSGVQPLRCKLPSGHGGIHRYAAVEDTVPVGDPDAREARRAAEELSLVVQLTELQTDAVALIIADHRRAAAEAARVEEREACAMVADEGKRGYSIAGYRIRQRAGAPKPTEQPWDRQARELRESPSCSCRDPEAFSDSLCQYPRCRRCGRPIRAGATR